ncbi:pilus assembly protein PilP [Marinospirillum insulare]|uniref:Type IV pilus assembly protein PilP n=1 Tax=Marinospirillum insulare TaxID=217169 RepID=A0ABQ5ZW80_9GAMM|nr:pilus assembly protein PilP [Marinospirillum insulare]GLR63692.1 hypothetical protein GCM10007878_11270 [Marinospirillum insulare]
MRALLLLALLLLLAACGDSNSTASIEDQLNDLRTRPHGKIEPLPEFPETTKAQYQQQERDPFLPAKNSVNSRLAAPDLNRPPTALEAWDLSQLSLRGSMKRGEIIKALVITPDNQLVSVAKGDRMGKDHGTIIHIDKNRILLRELIFSGSEWHEREQTLFISK